MKRLKELEHENGRLKRIYADLSLETAALKDVLAKKALRPAERREVVATCSRKVAFQFSGPVAQSRWDGRHTIVPS